MSYVPCIIIDNYDPINTELYNKLIKLQNKNNFKIIIIYRLENKLTNKILLDYLEERKNENFDYKYTRTLYDGLSELPNKYEKFFNYLIPTINSYLQINNSINEKEAKSIVEDEEKRIEKEIYKFFNNDKEQINLYLNEISILIDKEINIGSDFIKNIFLNTPLNIFDLEIISNDSILIKYSGETVKNVIQRICSDSIIDLLPKINNLNLDNFIKDGLFERGIKEYISHVQPIFGKIEKIVEFDCILNYFKLNKEYNFKDEEIKKKLKNLSGVKELKKQYKNFSFNNKIMVTQKQKGKDWDLLIISKNDNDSNNIDMCLIQVSLNKIIEQIQIILKYFEKKQIFIKRKIMEILNVKIINTHILFIFLKETQNVDTLRFLKKYSIPYIFFDVEKKSFVFDNTDKIEYFKLNDFTSFSKNCFKWEESLEYKNLYKEKREINNNSDYEYEEDVEEEKDEAENNIQNKK